MAKQTYHLKLKGYVGDEQFDDNNVDAVLTKNADKQVNVLIDSLGGSLAKALSIVAAFRNHGNVHVHFVGMNASAATIASLGAKHISIDSSAVYLIHKCSMEFFKWASANSDKLQNIIEEAEHMKADLDTMDANVAQMYAAKCKRKCEDLLELMKKGEWLTAQEALEWGFVDEIIHYEDDAAPVIDDRIAADMGAAGIPIPTCVSVQQQQPTNTLNRFIEALTNFFTHIPKPQEPMTPQTPPTEALVPTAPAPETQQTVSAEVHNAAIAEKDAEIARLNAEIEALKTAPGASTTQVVDETPKTQNAEVTDFEEYHKVSETARAFRKMFHN